MACLEEDIGLKEGLHKVQIQQLKKFGKKILTLLYLKIFD